MELLDRLHAHQDRLGELAAGHSTPQGGGGSEAAQAVAARQVIRRQQRKDHNLRRNPL